MGSKSSLLECMVWPWWPDRLPRAPVLPPALDNKPFWLPNDLAFPRVKVQYLKRIRAHSHKNGISPLSSVRDPSLAVSQSRGFWEPAFWSHCQSLPKLQQSLPTTKLDLKGDSVRCRLKPFQIKTRLLSKIDCWVSTQDFILYYHCQGSQASTSRGHWNKGDINRDFHDREIFQRQFLDSRLARMFSRVWILDSRDFETR